MKRQYFLFLFILCIILVACDQKQEVPVSDIPVCGIENPIQNIPWLSDLVKKTDNPDELYRGKVWLVRYKGQDIIVSTISYMYTSSQLYHCYDCEGNIYDPVDSDDFHVIMDKNKILLFSKP